MRTTYKHVMFECTKCRFRKEILHDISTPAPNPDCEKCQGKTEIIDSNDNSRMSYKGMPSPGGTRGGRVTLDPTLKNKWQERRVEQFKRTGK